MLGEFESDKQLRILCCLTDCERTDCGLAKREGWVKEGREFGISRGKLLYIGWITNKVLRTIFNIL